MAKITLVDGSFKIHGRLGDVVFKRAHTGEIILSKQPDMSKVQWSPAQKAQRAKFKAAVGYAKAAMADPHVQTVYARQAAETQKRPFDLAVSDYFKGRNLLEK